ncbi:MAG: ABC transporter permease subunit [Chloroflexi bacterium]|jgi:sn-glycerol 3-phosphate transport system permease protein|nr:ABC transporter permease subunit [Chloroflexota bacterium]
MNHSLPAEGSDLTASKARSRTRRRQKFKSAIEGYLYLAPTLIILSIFVFIPIFTSFRLSLNRVAPFGSQMIFVGLGNYTRLLADPDYWNSIRVSLLFMVGTVAVGITTAVFLAIALSYPLKYLSGLHRLLIFVPIVISSAVTGVLFKWIYHPVVGYVNYALELVGIEGPNWLASKEWALIAVMLAVAWRQLGFNVIIALAGIQNIDSTYYEAAKVDGANVWHRIRHITLPLLSPTLFFLLIINVINSLQVFGEINILTLGGPGGATNTMLYSIFFDAFVGTPFRGYASAQAYLLFLLILFMSFVQFRGVGRKVHYQ